MYLAKREPRLSPQASDKQTMATPPTHQDKIVVDEDSQIEKYGSNTPPAIEPQDELNPLVGRSHGQLMAEVDAFVEEFGLQADQETFRKGALVAQRQHDFANIPELTSEDKDSLEHEKKHKWHLPKALYLTVIVCALGAATQGWDQTGSNGASE